MNYAINLLSVVPMRKEPSHRSEMVSQLLFGEFALIEDRQDDFTLVRCLYDGYGGWVQSNQLQEVEGPRETDDYLFSFCSEIYVNGLRVLAPFGSPVYDDSEFRLGDFNTKYSGVRTEDWNSRDVVFNEENIEKVYATYLNTPYLWGGKSVFGIDCSGFVQQVFKFFGKKLLRDAYLQATQGEEVATLNDAQTGDLAFFKNEKERITHVGLILSGDRIVHASGRVRIDTITVNGVTNSETGQQSHRLHSIRRINNS